MGRSYDVDNRPVFVGDFLGEHPGGADIFLWGASGGGRPGWDGYLYSFFSFGEHVPSGDSSRDPLIPPVWRSLRQQALSRVT